MTIGDDFRPAAEVIGSIEMAPLPEGSVPVEAIVLTRYLDSEGLPCWAFRWSRGMTSPVDRIGPLTALLNSDTEEASTVYGESE